MSVEIATVVGVAAGMCTTGSIIPQVFKTFKTRHTKDISLMMYVFLTIGILLWLVYGIMINEMPIIVANGTSLIFTGLVLVMKFRYG
jgi:MtN3 and saliva related transmembrane protein